MSDELLENYERASAWTAARVAAAAQQLDGPTPCDDWDVRTLLNHMLETQRYFVRAARGEDVSPPGPTPPELDVAADASAQDKLLAYTGRDPAT